MRMLDASAAADADEAVTLADQKNINAFSRLNLRHEEVTDELAKIAREVEEMEEVETELELMDEDEITLYKVDATFLYLKAGEALTRLQAALEGLKDQKAELETTKEESEEKMEALKKVLYAKFGESINLEK